MNNIRNTFGIRFSTLSRQWRRHIDHQLSLLGIKDITWSPLIHLDQFGDGISQKQLANSVGIEGPALVRLLDLLELRGHIERRVCITDRRSKLVYLTGKGKKVVVEVRKHLKVIESEFLSRLSDEQLSSFHRVLDIMQTCLEEQE